MLGFLHRQKKPSRRNQFIHSTQKEARLQMDRYTDGHTDGRTQRAGRRGKDVRSDEDHLEEIDVKGESAVDEKTTAVE